jgi:hypothetical protein
METKLEAVHLRARTYAIRPENQLGTCGWYPLPWTVQFVIAGSAKSALAKANREIIFGVRDA